MPYDVFISYSSKDSFTANEICETITAEGLSCFIDKDGIRSSQEFTSIIIEAINNSKLLLFLASNNSYMSNWTLDEIFWALDKNKPILTYFIDDSSLPDNLKFRLQRYNWKRMSECPIEYDLIDDIKEIINTIGDNNMVNVEASNNYSKGKKYFDANNWNKAIGYFRQASEAGGHSEAEYYLGYIYQHGGWLVAKNTDEAIWWYKLSAEHGNKKAKEVLQYFERCGLGYLL